MVSYRKLQIIWRTQRDKEFELFLPWPSIEKPSRQYKILDRRSFSSNWYRYLKHKHISLLSPSLSHSKKSFFPNCFCQITRCCGIAGAGSTERDLAHRFLCNCAMPRCPRPLVQCESVKACATCIVQLCGTSSASVRCLDASGLCCSASLCN